MQANTDDDKKRLKRRRNVTKNTVIITSRRKRGREGFVSRLIRRRPIAGAGVVGRWGLY